MRQLVRSGFQKLHKGITEHKDVVLVAGGIAAGIFAGGASVVAYKYYYDIKQVKEHHADALDRADKRRVHEVHEERVARQLMEERAARQLAEERIARQLAEERAARQLAVAEERVRYEQRLFDAAFHADYQEWRLAVTARARLMDSEASKADIEAKAG